MLWFYNRESQKLEAETRFDNISGQYVLILRWPDGRVETETFPDAASFQRRVDRLALTLEAERWSQDGSPVLLQDGWRDTKDGTGF